MPLWGTFAGVTILVLVCLLALTHLTQRAFSEADDEPAASRTDADRSTDVSRPRADADRAESDGGGTEERSFGAGERPFGPEALDRRGDASENGVSTEPARGEFGRSDVDRPETERTRRGAEIDPADLSVGALLANVALSQGLFAGVLIGAAIYANVPAAALGIEFSRSYLVSGLLVGAAVGVALYVANEVGAASATWLGLDHDEDLRELLAPDSPIGWVVLLVGVLPVIAVFEELLFRAALIGALSAGFGIDPWLLAVCSSIAFGIGHGMQGSVGIVVTAALGFVLAAVFVYTGSLLVVVVAHYLINAFEFVVHEGLGLDWSTVVANGGRS